MPQFLRDFIAALMAEVRRLAFWSNHIDIVDEQVNRLVLNANNRRFVADRRTRHITAADRIIATFDAIQTVEIRMFENGDGPPYWTIALVTVASQRLPVGKTFDDSQASIAAARLATILGRQVVAVR